MWMHKMICASMVLGVALLFSGVSSVIGDVVDLSYLFDDLASSQDGVTAVAAEGDPVAEVDAVAEVAVMESRTPAAVDAGLPVAGITATLLETIAALERSVDIRDNQINELKMALEEVTTEFGNQVAEIRSHSGTLASAERSTLHEELAAQNLALEKMRLDYAGLEAAKAESLTDLAAELRSAHATALRDQQSTHQTALSALRAKHESETTVLLDTFESETATMLKTFESAQTDLTAGFQQEVAALQEKHAAEIASVRAQHAETITALGATHADETARLVQKHEALGVTHADETARLVQKHEELVLSLRATTEAEMASLRSSHKSEVAGLMAEFDAFRAETAREREAAANLRGAVSRLEAALRVAQTKNERERFLLAYNSGSLFLAAGRYDRAERELLKALALKEDDAPLRYNLGVLYDEHLRQPVKARQHYERFLELAPNDRDAPLVMQWLRELR